MGKKGHHHIYFQNKEHVVVGVISDTHGILVPAAIKALHGVDLIIHAGDIGNTGVMGELQAIAPVVAVSPAIYDDRLEIWSDGTLPFNLINLKPDIN